LSQFRPAQDELADGEKLVEPFERFEPGVKKQSISHIDSDTKKRRASFLVALLFAAVDTKRY